MIKLYICSIVAPQSITPTRPPLLWTRPSGRFVDSGGSPSYCEHKTIFRATMRKLIFVEKGYHSVMVSLLKIYIPVWKGHNRRCAWPKKLNSRRIFSLSRGPTILSVENKSFALLWNKSSAFQARPGLYSLSLPSVCPLVWYWNFSLFWQC